MTNLNCAVIGVGYLGRFHAQKYQALPNTHLKAVVDINDVVCTKVSQELGVPGYAHYQDLFDQVEAVSIAANTRQHYQIAKDCLSHGLHVLLEKPMTETVAQADELIAIAKQKQVVFQIGHIERFNPVHLASKAHLDRPLYLDAQRLAPFNPRGADVNVVLDLMIHDLDLILNLIKSPLVDVTAHGAPILTDKIDIATARLTFENRCVANLTASRISFVSERKLRLYQQQSYLSADYQQRELAVFKKNELNLVNQPAELAKTCLQFEKNDPLLDQIKAFITAIEQKTPPLVTAKEGREALALAETITSLIQINLVHHETYA